MTAPSINNLMSRKSCFEFRSGIEGEAAASAARNRTRSDLIQLVSVMNGLETLQLRSQPGLEEDFAFHLAVALASHNDYFVSVLQSLRSQIFEGMLLARTTSGLNAARKTAAINHQHRQIYVAIQNKDANAARFAMRSHLEQCKMSTNHWYVD